MKAYPNNTYTTEVDRISEEVWDSSLSRFSDSTVYQTWAYGRAQWGEKSLSHLVLLREQQPVALAQFRLVSLPLWGEAIAYLPWGPIWINREALNRTEVLEAVLKSIYSEYAVKRRLLVRIRPHVVATSAQQRMNLLTSFSVCGFTPVKRAPLYRTLVLDLTPQLDALRRGLNQKWRNRLNKSERNGLEIEQGSDIPLFESFRSMYLEMLSRKDFAPGVDIDKFLQTQIDLSPPHRMQILLCKQRGIPVAGAVVTLVGNVGIYLMGATADAGIKSQGAYLLQWRIIQWLKESGAEAYDLGGVNEDKNPGVFRFKKGISSNIVSHLPQHQASAGIFTRLLGFAVDFLNRQ